MIDIHTHILPGIDDGPQTVEESLEILRKAADEGMKALVATPHVLDALFAKDWQRVRDAFNCVKQAIVREEIDIEIFLGAELFISPDLPQMIMENEELTINSGNRYVVIELPFQAIPFYTEKTIFELLIRGIVPIIAHPERCLDIHNDPKKLFNLVQKGALTQMNIGSLLGRYGRKVQKTSKRLLRDNLIHIIASDIHSVPSGGYPLTETINIVTKIIDKNKPLQMVKTVPEKILRGETISEFI